MKKPEFSLFLDRDGVINLRKKGGYIRSWNEFSFLEGVLETMPILARKFAHIFVVTNQQGVAKGIMTEASLQKLHKKMVWEVGKIGGRIDQVYYCINHQKENAACRKPNTGMALQAKNDFPKVDFRYSVMVGDSPSDIEFGHRLGMQTVFVRTRDDIPSHERASIEDKIDFEIDGLSQLISTLEQEI